MNAPPTSSEHAPTASTEATQPKLIQNKIKRNLMMVFDIDDTPLTEPQKHNKITPPPSASAKEVPTANDDDETPKQDASTKKAPTAESINNKTAGSTEDDDENPIIEGAKKNPMTDIESEDDTDEASDFEYDFSVFDSIDKTNEPGQDSQLPNCNNQPRISITLREEEYAKGSDVNNYSLSGTLRFHISKDHPIGLYASQQAVASHIEGESPFTVISLTGGMDDVLHSLRNFMMEFFYLTPTTTQSETVHRFAPIENSAQGIGKPGSNVLVKLTPKRLIKDAYVETTLTAQLSFRGPNWNEASLQKTLNTLLPPDGKVWNCYKIDVGACSNFGQSFRILQPNQKFTKCTTPVSESKMLSTLKKEKEFYMLKTKQRLTYEVNHKRKGTKRQLS
eukprot:GEMP01029097.1.p1 GENE.GEMP01029097.1~~GEMP01029097.1.p1  ORF type:complete len:392 (+),score=52.81 GEMP01029097.1:41-1216(+)